MSNKRQRVYIDTYYVDILGKVCHESDTPIFELLELILDQFTEEMLKELVNNARRKEQCDRVPRA